MSSINIANIHIVVESSTGAWTAYKEIKVTQLPSAATNNSSSIRDGFLGIVPPQPLSHIGMSFEVWLLDINPFLMSTQIDMCKV